MSSIAGELNRDNCRTHYKLAAESERNTMSDSLVVRMQQRSLILITQSQVQLGEQLSSKASSAG